MKFVIIFLVIIFALLNFNCGNSSKVEKKKTTAEIEKTSINEGNLFYSCIYMDDPGNNSSIWYFNSKDSSKHLILKLPSNYGITSDNFILSPQLGFLAFYFYDSPHNRTNVYSINLENTDLAWLKSDQGNLGVDLVWVNDSLLYCNLNSGDKDSYSKEKYTSLINAAKNKSLNSFTPVRGNRLVGYVDNKYLLYEFDPGKSVYQNHYYLIDKSGSRIIKDFKHEDDSHGFAHFKISPSGSEFFHIPNKIYVNDKGKRIKEEELVVQKLNGYSDESVSHTQTGFANISWSPDGNVISFLKVGSINYNAITKIYTDIKYQYFYDVKTKQLTNLKTYQIDDANGVQSEFDIPKALPDGATIFNYINYCWSPSGKYLFINRQDLTMNSAINKCIIYDNVSKTEKTLIGSYQDEVNVAGWWKDDLILLYDGNKYTMFDFQKDRNITIPYTGKIIYLQEL